jgi:predicted nucleotidyltransferase
MGMSRLPPDFKDFLKLLNSKGVEYLIIGGYAVGYYGYPRATADLDVWIAVHSDNIQRTTEAIREFGFDVPELTPEVFHGEKRVIRMGVPPFRIEVLTVISGVNFVECYAARTVDVLDEVQVNFISLKHLKINKRACGRPQDIADLDHLP